MSTSIRAVIIDRDAARRALLTRALRLASPTSDIDGIEVPRQSDQVPDYVVLHVGDDGSEESMAAVHSRWLSAKVIIISTDQGVQREHLPGGSCCAHIQVPDGSGYDWAMGAVSSIMSGLSNQPSRRRAGVYETVVAIGGLIREWNTRLNREAA